MVVLGRVHSLPEVWTLLLEVTPTRLPSADGWFPYGGGLTAVPPMHCPALVTRSWPPAQDGIKQEKTNLLTMYKDSIFLPQRYLTLVHTYQRLQWTNEPCN